jgi:hypothetical protein
MQDQDPVGRKCVGTNVQPQNILGVPTQVVLPTEQVCSADGQLGVVLAISVPPVGESWRSQADHPGWQLREQPQGRRRDRRGLRRCDLQQVRGR